MKSPGFVMQEILVIKKNNTSGVKGVIWRKDTKKWQANVRVNYKRKHLGLYKEFSDAVRARYEAEKELGWKGCESNSPAKQWLIENGHLEGIR